MTPIEAAHEAAEHLLDSHSLDAFAKQVCPNENNPHECWNRLEVAIDALAEQAEMLRIAYEQQKGQAHRLSEQHEHSENMNMSKEIDAAEKEALKDVDRLEQEALSMLDRIECIYRKGWTTVGKRDVGIGIKRLASLARALAQEIGEDSDER